MVFDKYCIGVGCTFLHFRPVHDCRSDYSLCLRACWAMWKQVREDGGVEFINEGRGARLRVFAALKHRFLKQVRQASTL